MRHASERVFAIGIRPAQTSDERGALGLGGLGHLISTSRAVVLGCAGWLLCEGRHADQNCHSESGDEWRHEKSSTICGEPKMIRRTFGRSHRYRRSSAQLLFPFERATPVVAPAIGARAA